jgi:hypothetical protein
MHLVDPSGEVILLLRLAFAASQDRGRILFQNYPPTTVYTLVSRPSFIVDQYGNPTGKTDATEYALFYWDMRQVRPVTKVQFKMELLDWDPDPTHLRPKHVKDTILRRIG